MPPSLRECCLALWREGNNLIQARWDGILPQGSPSDGTVNFQSRGLLFSCKDHCDTIMSVDSALRKDMAICVSSIDIIKDMMLDR
uniref:Uncharacterized protein n=1 Tax=Oryza barthii TaxID=65489 RepID=A0A0D3HD09_9ORYZ